MAIWMRKEEHSPFPARLESAIGKLPTNRIRYATPRRPGRSPASTKAWLYQLALPAAAFEEDDADGGDGAFGDDDGPEDAARVHAEGDREEVGQGNFQEPEAEEIHDGGSDGVSRAVEGLELEHDHAVGVADVAVAENAQAGDGQRDDGGILREKANDRLGEDDEEEADEAEKDHVVQAGAPDGSFGALGLLGAEILADECGGGVAEAPTGHESKDEDADGDGVAGECGRAEDADDAHKADPTGVGDRELQNAGERDAQQAPEDAEVEMDLAAEDADALRAAEETIELIEHADAAADEDGEGGSGDAEFGERAPAEDEAGVENEIDDVGDPEEAHSDGGIACAAEDGVVEKKQHDGAAAAEGDARVAGTDGEDLRGRAHQAKQVRRVEETRNADERGDRESNGDGLNACDGGASGIFFADAAGDHGGGGKTEAEAEADGENQTEERFGEADGGDGVRAVKGAQFAFIGAKRETLDRKSGRSRRRFSAGRANENLVLAGFTEMHQVFSDRTKSVWVCAKRSEY
jgi:hypothetical protein